MFISLEGIDGSGKSTQAARLADHLRASGREVVLTREPGGSPGAEEIRRLLVEGKGERWSPQTELLLFTAARRDHLERTIRPALARGAIVVTDRFADSTRVYQGAVRADLRATVDTLHDLMIGVEPDLTLVIDIDPGLALSRHAVRGGAEDRFESLGAAFQQRLRDGFRALAAEVPDRIRLIDGTGSPDAVAARAAAAVAAAARMTDPSALPEPDRVPGFPHPRETLHVVGQDQPMADFVAAARSGRLHHAWLLTGPRGTGKATLAWAMARWLLADSDSDDLSVPADHPVARRIAALSEPRLQAVRRPVDPKTARIRAEITVEEIRRLLSFFHLSAAEGGRRVAIIDAADEMNTAAANALLKLLEEPPKDVTLLLIAHQPARLLPTIRSRCRTLRLSPLDPAGDDAGDGAAARRRRSRASGRARPRIGG